jgi:hypothetical protein
MSEIVPYNHSSLVNIFSNALTSDATRKNIIWEKETL